MPEGNGNSVVKGITVVLMIVALITGVVSIVTPMRNEIKSLEKEKFKLEQRLNKRIDDLRISIKDILEINKENCCREHEHNDKEHKDLKDRIEFIERTFMMKNKDKLGGG